MSYTLGLDIGTSSIGWALVSDEPDVSGGLTNIIAGVRVFPEGVDREKSGTEKSKNMARREARGMRRQHERKARRKRKLGSVLFRAGLLPTSHEELTEALKTSPYILRRRGLEEDLSLHEFGRALLHLGQRRGFKSNRKAEKADEGVVYEGISKIKDEMEATEARTLGELFANRTGPSRLRGEYTSREMYRHEFELLWERQSPVHPDVLTRQLKERIHDCIFFQRPLKPSFDKIGDCELEKGEKRCPKASWFAQEFRLLKEVNDLKIMEIRGEERKLTDEQRDALLKELHKNKEIKIEKMRKILGVEEGEVLNFENGKRTKMLGNGAEAALRKVFKKRFDEDPTFYREMVYESLIVDDQDEIERRAEEEWNLSEEEVAALFEECRPLPKGYLSYSRKAIKNLLPLMGEGLNEYDAREKAGYHLLREEKDAMDCLPLPPSVLPNMTNPIVRKALFEVRKVVNAILREYGRPSMMLVELARETKGNAFQRNEQLSENRKREKERERIRELLREQGLASPSGTDVLKYQLWEECGRVCPYTGRSISFKQLLGGSPEVQIEHILPYSRSLDDSQANKTLCFIDENVRKGNRTPFEAYGGDPVTWEALLVRIKSLPSNKRRKFTQKEIDLDKCIERQLNDTRYINRQVREYLQLLGLPVNVTRGQVTAELRWRWGLDSILNPNGDLKNRDDHRHHAMDAIVIALTTPSHLKNLSRKYDFKNEGKTFPDPWEGFREEVEGVIKDIKVSFSPTRKISGALHEETNYGPGSKEGEYVYRKPLEALTPAMVEKIRDPAIRAIVKKRLDECDGDVKRAFHRENPLTMPSKNGNPIPIKKVRIVTEASGMIPMKDTEGNVYRYVAPGSNHHISIFEYEVRGKKKREGVVTTMFEAARIAAENGKRRKQKLPDLPLIRKAHPTRPEARFLFHLCKNDLAWISRDGGPQELCRLQILSVTPQPSGALKSDLSFRLHAAAKRDDSKSLRRILSLDPEKVQIQKVTVDPLGRVYPAND